MSGAAVFEVRGLRVSYGAFEAVKGVGFDLRRGEILGLVGESGSGKSTVAKTLIGLEKPSGGTIVRAPDVSVQMIFQDAVGSLNPRMTVAQTLDEAAKCGGKKSKAFTINRFAICDCIKSLSQCNRKSVNRESKMPIEESKNRRIEKSPASLLSLVGLSDAVLNQYPREMSGGQCQRVSIARALAAGGDVLIADEPVSALDVSVQARVLNLLRDLRRDLGLTILLIAHDLAVVKNVCDRVAVMEKGRFVDFGDAAEVFARPQSDYTRRLLAVVPDVRRSLAKKSELSAQT